MKIGELAAKTGMATRMLRYYEEQGLIAPRRLPNGYRDYDDYLVDRVKKIRGLVESGVPTRIIGDILPCLNQSPQIVVRDADPELRAMLIDQRDAMNARIAALEQNRDALTRYVAAMDHRANPASAQVGPVP
ncbi:MerR family transcriptional regulator [Microbacterium arborescens]|jgi:DNA-binding transcriptional MerR regulator|uniref:MerR family transcriptional regulator n=1 Tax=Microbacterium arborescens TaxID=33883 RepID=UPI003C755D97